MKIQTLANPQNGIDGNDSLQFRDILPAAGGGEVPASRTLVAYMMATALVMLVAWYVDPYTFF